MIFIDRQSLNMSVLLTRFPRSHHGLPGFFCLLSFFSVPHVYLLLPYSSSLVKTRNSLHWKSTLNSPNKTPYPYDPQGKPKSIKFTRQGCKGTHFEIWLKNMYPWLRLRTVRYSFDIVAVAFYSKPSLPVLFLFSISMYHVRHMSINHQSLLITLHSNSMTNNCW